MFNRKKITKLNLIIIIIFAVLILHTIIQHIPQGKSHFKDNPIKHTLYEINY